MESKISSTLLLKEKKDKKEFSTQNSEITIEQNALLPNPSSNGNEKENIGLGEDFFNDGISVYVVIKGDTLSQIAEMFEVSTNTILWANNLKKGTSIKEGDILLILPVSGVKHIVKKGETLKGIAKKYKAEISDIAAFNGIAEDSSLSIGDELIIPDGQMFIDAPTTSTSNNSNSKTPTRSLPGYFINPVPGSIRTQGLHGKNAVDLAEKIGTPIKASAEGTVLVARMGWNGGYGGLIIIQHPNGTKTLYSHLSSVGVSNGQKVTQGEIIGKMGNTGHVRPSPGGTGSHLHFEVHGAKNPGVNGSWAK
ncbi:MAG: peptidoglycan DD-metalloendopeptidase family protein [Candidatus Paceibacterota bacterium]